MSFFVIIRYCNFLNMADNYAFIDSQNLNLAIRNQGWVLSFRKFRRYLLDKYDIKKAFMFVGYLSGNESLYTTLQEQGFIIIFKPTLILPNGKVKGNVDAELVLHSMIEYPNYDKALIVSNDGDFHCLVEYLEKQEKLLKLMIPDRHSYSSLLRKFRPHFAYMNNLRHKLEHIKKERQ